MKWKVLDAFGEAASMVGIPQVPDFNGGDNFGCGYFQVNQKNGRRWSAASAFLKPILYRPNLQVETGVKVNEILIEHGRAVGVAWLKDGERFEAYCNAEVVLAAGAVGTPNLLELSGIGDTRRLTSLGLISKVHAPGSARTCRITCRSGPITRSAACRP